MSPTALRPRRRSAGHARRPRTPLRKRVGLRLPSRGRVLALLLLAGLLGGLVTLVNGPWLRVQQIAHAGERFTSTRQLNRLLAGYRGAALLALDSGELAERLRELPAVADARVETLLPDALKVTISEKAAALTWQTTAARLVVAADGAVIAELAEDATLPPELAALPAIDDRRPSSRVLTAGDELPGPEWRAAVRLLDLDPALLGSEATSLSVRVDREYGFVLVSAAPAWEAALGFYQRDPTEDADVADSRLERQVAAIRTLFAAHAEGTVRWLDARNPGKVYWAP